MPLVIETDPILKAIQGTTPIEQRNASVQYWLQGSVKISVTGASGSGTLCSYDRATNTAYVISCGHLWSETKSATELKNKNITAKVTMWYHNDIKLTEPRTYVAKVIFYSNKSGFDMSLLAFTPDFIPTVWFPIAPINHPVVPGEHVHSMGCDGGKEVAHYDVEIVESRGNDLITKNNSPRPGRSGGGLVDNSGFYIGICWGTSDYSGSGTGYFTPLRAIHQMFASQGYGFLLNQPLPNWGLLIPIRDMNGPKRIYPPSYVPVPVSS